MQRPFRSLAGPIGLAFVLVACSHARDPTVEAMKAQDAAFESHADAAARYLVRARTNPRLAALAYREALRAAMVATPPCPGGGYCPPAISASLEARLAEMQAIVASGRPREIEPQVSWTLSGSHSCEPVLAALRARVRPVTPSAIVATVELSHCELAVDTTPWSPNTCLEPGSSAYSPCPESSPVTSPAPKAQASDNDGEVHPGEPTPFLAECPCQEATAAARVTIRGSVRVAEETFPFHHHWSKTFRDRILDRSLRTPALPAPSLPTVDQLAAWTAEYGGNSTLSYAAYALAVIAADPDDSEARELECVALASRYGLQGAARSAEMLDLGLFETAARRCEFRTP